MRNNEEKFIIREANVISLRQKPAFGEANKGKDIISEEKQIDSFVSLTNRRKRTFYWLNSGHRLITSEVFYTIALTAKELLPLVMKESAAAV